MKTPKLIAIIILTLSSWSVSAQRYFTKAGSIYFNASGDMEVIEATNKTVTSVMDIKTGAIQFAVLMKAFQFEKALMEEHFNENYVESTKFPKTEFKGEIVNNKEISYDKDGSYAAKVKGKLSIHGVTQEVEATGTISIKAGKVQAQAEFVILLSDYNIEIPSLVKDKLSKSAKIKVDCLMELLKG
jgi:hypothetical protein